MAIYVPSREQYREYATRGNLIPVYREVVADADTPVSAFAKVGNRDYSFLLESVLGGEKWAAYSFIGVAPRIIFRASKGRVQITRRDVEGGGPERQIEVLTEDPIATLQDLLADFHPEPPPGLPRFFGGAVGYVGYDVVRSFEHLPAHLKDDLGLPEAYFVITDTLLIFDNLRQTLKVVANSFCPSPEHADACYDAACQRIDVLAADLRQPIPPRKNLDLDDVGPVPATTNVTRDEYMDAVLRAKEYILAGDAFQIVLSQRFEVPREGIEPFDVYRALRVVNPSPYMFHLRFPEVQVTGASPECMVRLEGDVVEVRPLAGTRRRGETEEEDEALIEELLADPKERAEHVMLVDLGRNDLGRVAAVGSVEVDEFMTVEGYSHVMHIVSSVHGHLAPGKDASDVLRATFPAGTLAGAPKIRAMEIIEELEPCRRGVYGGAIGYLSFTGNLDLAIAIRTLISVGDSIYVQAGAGIVHDSDPEHEYDETVAKATAVVRAVSIAKGT
jgi:anthranilate synthase component I